MAIFEIQINGLNLEIDAPDAATAASKARAFSDQQAKPADPQAPQENVVATTPDGGRVIKRENGQLVFASPAYSTSDPEQVARIMEGATPAEVSVSSFDQQTIAQNPIAARGAKFVQGMPFVGQYADEAVGLAFGDAAKGAMRATQGAMDRERPAEALALQIGGGVVGSAPLAPFAASTIGSLPLSIGAKSLVAAGAGAVAGGTEGLVSGYGRGTEGNRLATALGDGAMGAGFGAVIGGLGPMASEGIKKLATWVKGRDQSIIAKTLGISPGAARIIRDSLEADDFTTAAKALKASGVDSMLADAGPASAQMLDTAMSTGGSALRVGREAVESRAAASGTKFKRLLDGILGAPEGIKSAARGISERTSSLRRAAYDRAYSIPINYADDTGRAIEGVLDRIPPKTLMAGINEANDAMRAAGVSNMQIMAEIADDGRVVFREMPNVQQLDEVKKALGGIAATEVDKFGRPTAAGIRAGKLAEDLRNAVGDAVPQYRTAVKLGGDKIQEDNLLRIGKDLLTRRVTREDVATAFAGASREAKAAARAGLRSHIDETMANARLVISNPALTGDGAEIREAISALKEMGSRANLEKMEIMLGKGPANALFGGMEETLAHLELRAAVARNSATASRQAGMAAAKEAVAPGAVGEAMRGRPVNATQRGVQWFFGTTPQDDAMRMRALWSEVATALTQKRGPEAEAALEIVQKAIAGQPIKEAEAAQLSRLLASSGLLPAYQYAVQGERLSPR